MERVRVGILGPGNIVRRVMTDWKNVKNCELTAVASRDMQRARGAADEYGAKYAFGSYEDLANCGEVDLVYIATPHNFHCAQALLMMEHGKHVLCEKPMPLNDAECERMIACAKENRTFLMEAMWTRFLPASRALKALVAAGEIGEVKHFEACSAGLFPYDPRHRLFAPELAGGILMDMGVYLAMPMTMLLGCDCDVQGFCAKAPTGVDVRASVDFQYPSGATGHMALAVDANAPSYVRVCGTEGYAEYTGAIWAPTELTVVGKKGAWRKLRFPSEHEGHHYQFDHAAECIRSGLTESPEMPLAETLGVSRMFTKLRRAWEIVYPEEA